ncbi:MULTISPECIES: DUF736 domain-containing protein [unclassified Sphingomonas]|uniref:DUF736 domain-containing protein n=1 Tax=unclassified Sphingomonas TaxID=196159 RepID=UPI0002E853E3|nr:MULTISPECIES: DUF736 domain-containing protein [unclassified Sphingomonas]KTF67862.1 hypothetical protein ATB93_16205 [Sphingomonas sp. WG]
MNIGEFKRVASGDLLGSIASVTIDLPRLGLKPIRSDNDRAPAFEIMALNVAKRWVQVGSLWAQVSNTSGETFYQGRLEDPSFTAPLPIMLFGDDVDGFRVVWNRPDRGTRDMDGNRRSRRGRQDDAAEEANEEAFPPLGGAQSDDEAPKANRRQRRTRSDCFEGNATDAGKLVGAGTLEDEVGF